MTGPRPPEPNDVRFRRDLDAALPAPRFPAGYVARTFTPADAPDVHALLMRVFDDEEPDFDRWWTQKSTDPEYDPSLCFVVFDERGDLVALAWCWTSGFLKDLAVALSARRKGIAEALCLQVFAAFRVRGAGHVDLKTNLIFNADAARLYGRLGMYEVDWAG